MTNLARISLIAILGSAVALAGCGEQDTPVVPTPAPTDADAGGKPAPKAPVRRGAGREEG